MHPHPHIHAEIARDTQRRRLAEARNASIGASRRRQLSTSAETPAQGLFARLVAVALRTGA